MIEVDKKIQSILALTDQRSLDFYICEIEGLNIRDLDDCYLVDMLEDYLSYDMYSNSVDVFDQDKLLEIIILKYFNECSYLCTTGLFKKLCLITSKDKDIILGDLFKIIDKEYVDQLK